MKLKNVNEILDKLESVLQPETVVTDVCSLKTFVSKKKRPYKFVPSHPMAGTEHKGYENGIDYKKIMCSLPFMFGDLVESVTFVADANVIDYVIDDFGNSAKIKDIGDNKFEISVMASPNAMEYWAMQYLNFAEIVSPAGLREKIKQNIDNAKEKYK